MPNQQTSGVGILDGETRRVSACHSLAESERSRLFFLDAELLFAHPHLHGEVALLAAQVIARGWRVVLLLSRGCRVRSQRGPRSLPDFTVMGGDGTVRPAMVATCWSLRRERCSWLPCCLVCNGRGAGGACPLSWPWCLVSCHVSCLFDGAPGCNTALDLSSIGRRHDSCNRTTSIALEYVGTVKA